MKRGAGHPGVQHPTVSHTQRVLSEPHDARRVPCAPIQEGRPMGRGRGRRKAPRPDEGGVADPGGKYAQSRGGDCRRLLLGAPARAQKAECGDQRGPALRDCAQRSRGGGRREAALRRKAGESSEAWPYSDVFFTGRGKGYRRQLQWVSERLVGCTLRDNAPVRISPCRKVLF